MSPFFAHKAVVIRRHPIYSEIGYVFKRKSSSLGRFAVANILKIYLGVGNHNGGEERNSDS